MSTQGVHAVIVPPMQDGAPLVVTDLELVRAVVERPPDTKAGDLAREPVATLSTQATLAEAVELMAVRYITHLLATDPTSGAPAGIVSSLDLSAVVGGIDPRPARMPRPPSAGPPPARVLSEVRIGDVMLPGVVTCAPDAPLTLVARILADQRVHCVAVAGIDGRGDRDPRFTWGLISDIDLVVALHGGSLATPAATIAAGEPPALQEDDHLDRAAELMVDHVTTHVVAVGPTGLPSGIVSTLDVARIVAASR